MQCSTQLDQLASGLRDFQANMPKVIKDSVVNVGKYRFKYADLPTILDAVLPELTKRGLSIAQTMGSDGTLETTLLHVSGQWLTGSAITPIGPNTLPQEAGSAITYFRRYGICAMLGIAADDDNDVRDIQKPPVDTQKPEVPPQDRKAVPVTPPPQGAAHGQAGGFVSLKSDLNKTAKGPEGRQARLAIAVRVSAAKKEGRISKPEEEELRGIYVEREHV
jgi:hypothetical protein